jgi:hypothetical protein
MVNEELGSEVRSYPLAGALQCDGPSECSDTRHGSGLDGMARVQSAVRVQRAGEVNFGVQGDGLPV